MVHNLVLPADVKDNECKVKTKSLSNNGNTFIDNYNIMKPWMMKILLMDYSCENYDFQNINWK